MRTALETLTYSICLFQIQLRIVAGFTPNACAASLTGSMFAIFLPPCPRWDDRLPSDVLYAQRMIFVEQMKRAISPYLPTTWASDISVDWSRDQLFVMGRLPNASAELQP